MAEYVYPQLARVEAEVLGQEPLHFDSRAFDCDKGERSITFPLAM